MSKVAIVTGGAKNIGRAICLKMAGSLAMNVVVVDVDEENSREVVKEIKALGRDALAVTCDVSNSTQIDAMVKKSFEFGDVGVLVNNAGITRDAMLLKMEEKDWDLVMDINLKSMFLITKAVCAEWVRQAKEMAAKAGEEKPAAQFYRNRKVVNISSIVAEIGNFGQANYSSSKAGVLAFTKTVAKEMARYNITVNAVLPGFITTQMTDKIPAKILDKFIDSIPLQRKGLPEDIANAVGFLASEEASYVTATSLKVDGGLSPC
jgi:3-oxoacyl-[acyl-carrier protein] reductase